MFFLFQISIVLSLLRDILIFPLSSSLFPWSIQLTWLVMSIYAADESGQELDRGGSYLEQGTLHGRPDSNIPFPKAGV